MKRILIVCLAAAALASLTILVGDWSGASAAAGANASSNGNETFDVNTLAGKVASVNGTAGWHPAAHSGMDTRELISRTMAAPRGVARRSPMDRTQAL